MLRHANATECSIELSSERFLTLIIEDDGIGMHGAFGNGIQGMSERLRQADGTLTIADSRLGGMRVLAQLPSSLMQERESLGAHNHP